MRPALHRDFRGGRPGRGRLTGPVRPS
jgi:hypothetical protein